MAETEQSTRWLSAEEQQAWIGVTAVMWLLPGPLDAQLQRDSGLTLFEYMVLSSLSMAEGRRQRMRELAALTNASPSRLSNVVGKLEARGWVRRVPDPDDRRGAIAELSESGWDTVVAAAPGHVEAVRTYVLDRLQPEQVAALQSLGAALVPWTTPAPAAAGERGVDDPGAACSEDEASC